LGATRLVHAKGTKGLGACSPTGATNAAAPATCEGFQVAKVREAAATKIATAQ